jgi:heme a synthase
MPRSPLARFAWAVLAFNLLVILWGAFVRASGSGAGCGSHWPLCDGQVLPRAPSAEQAIEYTHRATSGLALLAVTALWVLVRRRLPRADPARAAAFAAFLLVLVEAALGAWLVLYGLVADDASPARAVIMPLHLVNTLLLIGALALAARLLDDQRPLPARRSSRVPAAAALVLGLLMLAGASGAVAALGDTLFPARSLGEALAQDFSPAAPFLLRLRLAHPALAVAAVAAVLLVAARAPEGARWVRAAAALALAQILVGVVNVLLLAPVALQLVHLALADLLWIAAVLAFVDWPASAAAGP